MGAVFEKKCENDGLPELKSLLSIRKLDIAKIQACNNLKLTANQSRPVWLTHAPGLRSVDVAIFCHQDVLNTRGLHFLQHTQPRCFTSCERFRYLAALRQGFDVGRAEPEKRPRFHFDHRLPNLTRRLHGRNGRSITPIQGNRDHWPK